MISYKSILCFILMFTRSCSWGGLKRGVCLYSLAWPQKLSWEQSRVVLVLVENSMTLVLWFESIQTLERTNTLQPFSCCRYTWKKTGSLRMQYKKLLMKAELKSDLGWDQSQIKYLWFRFFISYFPEQGINIIHVCSFKKLTGITYRSEE